jgi:hypothetical protein
MKKGTLTSPSSFYVRSVLHESSAPEAAKDMPEPPTLVDPVSVDRLKSVLENALRDEMRERDKKQSSRPPPVLAAVTAPSVPQAPRPMKAGLPTVIPSNRPPPRRALGVAPVVQAVLAASIAIGAAVFILAGAH